MASTLYDGDIASGSGVARITKPLTRLHGGRGTP